MYKKTTLPNGLRIITVPAKNTNTVTVLALVGTGSKYESKEISGISHFLEHLFFKGTKKRPTEMDVMGVMDNIGGEFNAFTGPDYTGYYAKVQSSKLETALEWVADMYLNAVLPAEEIEKERGTIIEEINMFYDHPMRYIWTLWNNLLYGDQPAGWDIAGTKETVSKISRGDLARYRSGHYVARDTIICVSGKFSENKAKQFVKKYFAAISTDALPTKVPVTERQEIPQALIHPKKTEQTQVALGVRAFNLSYPKRYALEIMNVALGGMATSRLMEEVRIKRGLSYFVHSELGMDPDVGVLVALANLDSSRVDEGIGVMLGEFRKIAQKGIADAELRKAKDYYIGKSSLLLESSHAQASFYADQELLEGKIQTPEQIYARINRVSAKEIHEVARDIFKPEKLNLAVIGPYEDKSRFQKLLDDALL